MVRKITINIFGRKVPVDLDDLGDDDGDAAGDREPRTPSPSDDATAVALPVPDSEQPG
jgi:hypothetical protein